MAPAAAGAVCVAQRGAETSKRCEDGLRCGSDVQQPAAQQAGPTRFNPEPASLGRRYSARPFL